MSKKTIWYSQPLSEIWDSYRKSNKDGKLSPKEFIWEWILPQIKNPFLANGNQVQAELLVAEMFYLDTQKEFLHLYFIDKSLRNFLLDLPIKDFDGLMHFIIENGVKTEIGGMTSFGDTFKTGKKSMSLNFGIHVPYEGKNKGYAFGFIFQPENNKVLFNWLVGSDTGYISVEQYKTFCNERTEYAKNVSRYFQLAVNTLVYMSTFPNCVVEGVPKLLKEEYAKKIEISEKVIDIINTTETTRLVSPHSRRAYFKRLTSDFYTHKKGQTILVKETMVNGKAKTIYMASNLEKMKEETSSVK